MEWFPCEFRLSAIGCEGAGFTKEAGWRGGDGGR